MFHRYRFVVQSFAFLWLLGAQAEAACCLTPDSSSHQSFSALQSHPTRSAWQYLANRILFRLGGDDLKARFGVVPEVVVLPDKIPAAYVLRSGRIYVSLGFLSLTRNLSEVAFILGHELGHLSLEHKAQSSAFVGIDRTSFASQLERELGADWYAQRILSEAGFSQKAGYDLLSRLHDYRVEDGYTLGELHRSLAQRRDRLQSTARIPANSSEF